jgi:hypothetical protein
MFDSDWAPDFPDWLVSWQLGNAGRDPDPNVLKKMHEKTSKGLPMRDRDAVERDDFGPMMLAAARESFCKRGKRRNRAGNLSADSGVGVWVGRYRSRGKRGGHLAWKAGCQL